MVVVDWMWDETTQGMCDSVALAIPDLPLTREYLSALRSGGALAGCSGSIRDCRFHEQDSQNKQFAHEIAKEARFLLAARTRTFVEKGRP